MRGGYVMPLLLTAPSRGSLSGFGAFGSIPGTSLTAFCDAIAVQRATDDMVADAWQIFHAPTTNKYYGMLLQIMAFTWNVSGYFQLIGQTHTSDFAHCRIRLLRCHCAHLGADATLLGRTTQAQGLVLQRIVRVQQRRGLDLFILLSTSFADELIDRWQLTIPLSFYLAVNYSGPHSLTDCVHKDPPIGINRRCQSTIP